MTTSSGHEDGYMLPRGGTDLMVEGLNLRINQDDYGVNIISCKCLSELVVSGKTNIMWQHLNVDEPFVQNLRDPFFQNSLDAIVFVSHWQLERYRMAFNVDMAKSYVLKNAINPIEYKPKSRDGKLRLIYASAPYRGLEPLLDVFDLINRDDIELHVYSSTLMYGTDFDKRFRYLYENLFERAENTDGVTLHGYAPNSEVVAAMQEAHIFAYPSIFEETSCIALIEAAAAGCSLVTTSLGALPETSAEYASLVVPVDNKEVFIAKYAKALNDEIDEFWNKQEFLKEQSSFFNSHYSWETRLRQWKKFLESFK